MNLTVTQENLKSFLPGKISWVAEMYAKDHNCSVIDALKAIYASEMYKQLEKEDTKLWHLGPVALYEIMKEEQ